MKIWIVSIILLLTSTVPAALTVFTRKALDDLTPPDRIEAYNWYKNNVKSCTIKYGEDHHCGRVKGISQGDPNFKDPFYAHIPQPTSVQVFIECDEKERKFYTTVYYKDKNGHWANFKNPLYDPSNSSQPREKSNSTQRGSYVERWLTSPGIYNYHPANYPGTEENWAPGMYSKYPHYRWRTPLETDEPLTGNRDMIMNEWHVVSENKDWAGDKMPWATQIKEDIFIHASNDVTGYPESHGCIRVKSTNAMALFNLIRRAGTSNVAFHWGGYGRLNPKTGEPFCAGKYDKNGRLIKDNNRVYAAEGTQDRIVRKSQKALNETKQRTNFNFFKIKSHGIPYIPPPGSSTD